MRLRILSVQDLGSGLIFMSFGAIAVVLAPSYHIGTALRMGPGYFPLILGGLMVLVGAALILRSFRVTDPPPALPRLRPFAAVIAAAAIFALIVDSAGVVVTSIVTLTITYSGVRGGNRRELLLLCIGMTAAVCVVFIYILGMPLYIWPPLWN